MQATIIGVALAAMFAAAAIAALAGAARLYQISRSGRVSPDGQGHDRGERAGE